MAQQDLDLFGNPIETKGDLKKKFGANPFTILDTKDGLWQARKKRWINMGIKSEVGRDAVTYHMKDWADKKGEYYGFVADTVKLMQRCSGMTFYNDAILATSLASAALRAGGNMKSGKLVKVHQNVLMFKKV